MAFTVGELSRLTGVTVRALHHYDEIGLIRPSQRTAAGYRLYDKRDVLRLQQVLVLRELGVPLDDIGPAIDASADRAALLRKHRGMLAERRTRIDAMLAAVDAALEVLEEDRTMQPEDFKAMFDGFNPADHEDEARERWGSTPAYHEASRRTKQYGKPEWEAIRKESEEIYTRIGQLMQQGAAASDPAVQAAVEDHRKHIDRWFYPCSSQMHRGLGEMYVADPRFTATLDKKGGPGLARFLRDAIAVSP
ncbi:MAG: MerR family transcriptional regulator [Deltaproteobacteria bacterium]|nr:MAG: MerR family transcriptional regulator [Deltaproteobacteria bacterium]TMQ23668.1 MAG: MerR family transcriptional regulator [Deltaproteobacteria bacterium]